MDSKLVISIESLAKKYYLGNRFQYTLRGALAQLLTFKKKTREEFWALKDIDLDVNQGEVIGIIGRNGAGKSTLLKILSRITYPTKGNIKIYGKVASLLEVGTGFHPELTGRENIFLNGSLLGMTRNEIKNQFNDIVDFSGIQRFIDTPVKRYSSGMYVRLAFSVAAFLNSEILLIDEVLAVGDLDFQQKCLGKMEDVVKSGKTILFVSHDLQAIRDLCNKSIIIEKGKLVRKGETDDIIKLYKNMVLKSFNQPKVFQSSKNLDVKVLDFQTIIEEESTDLEFIFTITNNSNKSIFNLELDLGINDKNGERIGWLSTRGNNIMPFDILPLRKKDLTLTIKHWPFIVGMYSLTLCLYDGEKVIFRAENAYSFKFNRLQGIKTYIKPKNQGNVFLNYNWKLS